MAQVNVWGGLQAAVGDVSVLEIKAKTIRQLIQQLQLDYPATKPYVATGIAVSIDGVLYRDSWDTQIPAGAEIYLLPRIVGG